MDGTELTLYQKVSAHERIKPNRDDWLDRPQVSQVVGDDLKEAIGPLNQVNFKTLSTKGILEVLR